MSLWLLFIILHALMGVVSFWSGLLVLTPAGAKKHPLARKVYGSALVGLVVFMSGAMAAHWHEISTLERGIYSGLVVLALYMLYRAVRAFRSLRHGGKPEQYIDGIGFTLISLLNGFVIVGAIDLGAPPYVIVGLAIAAVIVGHHFLVRTKKRYAS